MEGWMGRWVNGLMVEWVDGWKRMGESWTRGNY